MEANRHQQFVEVGIAGERYAFPIYDIREIIKLCPITAIPHSRQHLEGVVNLRGKILPVVSLRGLLGRSGTDYGKTARIVVVQAKNELLGIIVEHVSQVITFTDIQPPSEGFGSEAESLVTGIALDPKGMVGLLDIHRLHF